MQYIEFSSNVFLYNSQTPSKSDSAFGSPGAVAGDGFANFADFDDKVRF